MKTLEFESGLDPRKKLMVILFWTNRKAARTEGCAPFLLNKIITPDKTYSTEGTKLLKLNEEILEELERNIDNNQPIIFQIAMGEEFIETTLEGDIFTISVQKSGEIEEEVIDKLNLELGKKYPSVCESFTPRITPQE